ncbi:MAG TPA: virulence RhuM family protein [Kofleriaceae bacterium]|jgi:hypothetical protein|nr:virulence RhuM family protein [Kofleriaceae bacterium]
MTHTAAPTGQILLYRSEDGRTRLDVQLENETVWLNQRQLTELFGKAKGTISEHLKHIFEDGELDPVATVRPFRTVQREGDREVVRDVEFYNLDIVIALGFRVRSPAAVRFRQWAADRLKEYIVKGFVLDDERLKRTDRAADYFDELLARIREIRASEARVYQRIREIFALASDYDESDQATLRFFAFMQNKMHYAATGLTAAAIVRCRADAERPNVGLTSWSGGRVLKRDVGTAKNYLDAQEIDTLNRIVVMFLDRAEFRAQRRRDIKMADWEIDLDKFLADTELPVLSGAGAVSHEEALDWAGTQYDAFAERRRVEIESEASERYLDDLAATAKLLEDEGTKPPPKLRQARGKKRG